MRWWGHCIYLLRPGRIRKREYSFGTCTYFNNINKAPAAKRPLTFGLTRQAGSVHPNSSSSSSLLTMVIHCLLLSFDIHSFHRKPYHPEYTYIDPTKAEGEKTKQTINRHSLSMNFCLYYFPYRLINHVVIDISGYYGEQTHSHSVRWPISVALCLSVTQRPKLNGNRFLIVPLALFTYVFYCNYIVLCLSVDYIIDRVLLL